MPRDRDHKHVPEVTLEGDDRAILRQVVDCYHETLKATPEALAYLAARHLNHPEVVGRLKLGYSNRTLGYSLPNKLTKAGAEIRGRLMNLGILRESGHEHFTGSLVVPVFDDDGNVVQLYGRKLLDNLRKGTPLHTYLPGPARGVWNLEALKESKDIIVAKSLIEALTFWCAGFRNVTAVYGPGGITPDHLAAFQRYGTQHVLIGLDSNEAGDRAADALADQLADLGITCARIQFPKGSDASSLRLRKPPEALGKLIGDAVPMARSTRPRVVVPAPMTEPMPMANLMPAVAIPEPLEPIAALSSSVVPVPAVVSFDPPSTPPKLTDGIPTEIHCNDLMIDLGVRMYRVRGWQKPLNPESLKVNVLVSKGDRFHVDTLDLYQAKARTAFIRQAAQELPAAEDILKRDLGIVLRKVEGIQADFLTEALKPKDTRPPMTDQEREDALALLTDPDLTGRILQDFEALGVVGEESNLLTGYLAAVSRLLDRPLALLIQSASAAGKSSLMDAVLDLMPEEDVVRYSAMSGQSLFYMADRDLRNKILSIAEEEGARHASYALKLLQSEGRVTMASTGKNPTTGMLETHEYAVEGPVMLFLTTTALNIDDELMNRCLVLTVNESREQTRAIHARQRRRETLEGMLARTERGSIITRHRNAQRLLKPLVVVNPYADQLGFQDHQTRSRRDHLKYLTLMRSIALLHQHQREVRTWNHQGQALEYIEVTPSDIALANRLAHEVLGRTVDELLPQTRKLLLQVHEWVGEACAAQGIWQADFRFTRRQVREALGWGDTQIKLHMGRLAELEFLVTHRGKQGRTFLYELVFQGEDAEGRARLLGLIDPADLQPTSSTTTSRGKSAHFAGDGRGKVGVLSAGSRGSENTTNAMTDKAIVPTGDVDGEKGAFGVSPAAPSYPSAPDSGSGEVG